MAESIRCGTFAVHVRIRLLSHDIGGFEKLATTRLVQARVAFGMLSSHSRLHGNESYRVPWDFDEEAAGTVGPLSSLSARLMPYLFAQACRTHETGLPMMRSWCLNFLQTRSVHIWTCSTCLGESLLVAPTPDDGKAVYYLPKWQVDTSAFQ
jgi:alpha-D-xyloside xylohydrolase